MERRALGRDAKLSCGWPSKPRLALAESAVPEAFAVGVHPSRSFLVVTRGLLDRLDPRETEAVLAHELAHVVNRDGAVMTAASPGRMLVSHICI
jgi:Zn-dependent protease with chaperone function